MSLTFRRGTPNDAATTLDVFARSLADFNRRFRGPQDAWADPAVIITALDHSPLFDHLARTADQWWVAEDAGDVVGYARSILRAGTRDLTDFFVLPDRQSAGIGRELLARAFSPDGVRHRVVLATPDMRAQIRYLKSGVYPRFPFRRFWCKPEAVRVDTDLTIRPVATTPETLAALRRIDQAVLDYTRDADHAFLLRDQQGYLYERGAEVVGYGYVGNDAAGPIALLNAADFPAVLAHAEREVAGRGAESIGLQIPLINQTAVRYVLERNYRVDDVPLYCMSDTPFGKLDQYIVVSMPMFL
jgi:GNAT superfamily N-acetyltransferase